MPMEPLAQIPTQSRKRADSLDHPAAGPSSDVKRRAFLDRKERANNNRILREILVEVTM